MTLMDVLGNDAEDVLWAIGKAHGMNPMDKVQPQKKESSITAEYHRQCMHPAIDEAMAREMGIV
jgi:hypothetical protein